MKKLIFILPFILFACKHVESPSTQVHFTFRKVIFVEGKINNKKTLFLFDTGASLSVLDVSQGNYYGFSYTEDINHAFGGIGGGTSLYDVSKVQIEINGIKYDFPFKGADLSDVNSFVQFLNMDKIGGIIGSDFMSLHKVTISFEKDSIYIK